jgi:hypothetical protein
VDGDGRSMKNKKRFSFAEKKPENIYNTLDSIGFVIENAL